MKTRTIRQTINFPISPDKLYELRLNAKKMSAIQGSKSTVNKRANGKFSVFDDYCHGYNIELIPGEKIVQAWHFNEEGWPDDHYSTCTFIFLPSSKGTKLTFIQSDVPANQYESLKNGWHEYYWKPILSTTES